MAGVSFYVGNVWLAHVGSGEEILWLGKTDFDRVNNKPV